MRKNHSTRLILLSIAIALLPAAAIAAEQTLGVSQSPPKRQVEGGPDGYTVTLMPDPARPPVFKNQHLIPFDRVELADGASIRVEGTLEVVGQNVSEGGFRLGILSTIPDSGSDYLGYYGYGFGKGVFFRRMPGGRWPLMADPASAKSIEKVGAALSSDMNPATPVFCFQMLLKRSGDRIEYRLATWPPKDEKNLAVLYEGADETPNTFAFDRFGIQIDKVDPEQGVRLTDFRITYSGSGSATPSPKPSKGSAVEKDSRLHSDGSPWRFDKAPSADPALPRVLLVGDSILNGYLPAARNLLAGVASVDAWVNPLFQSEAYNKGLAVALANGPYAVIQINTGLHGWAQGRIPEGQFVPLTQAFVDVIRKKCPGAKVIWASSTPVTVKGTPTELDSAINPLVVEQNRLAAEVMKNAGIPVNDFYGSLVNQLSLARGDGFHWKPEAYKILAVATADRVKELLTSK